MKVLIIHNYYQQAGGEDIVVAREGALMAAHGHDVHLHTVSNDSLRSTWEKIGAASRAPYSVAARRSLAAELDRFRPDIVHAHNFFPLLTPSIYDACRAARVPVVQTLHNYRLLCLNAALFRAGHICEACVGRAVPWPGIVHACYRGSLVASAAVAATLTLHRLFRTWTGKIDIYIALTEFARAKFIQGGLSPAQIVVKPNFVHPDPGLGDHSGSFALFVSRLSADKGAATLLAACEQLNGRVAVKIVGSGPMADQVAAAATRIPSLEWLGERPLEQVIALMKQATCLIVPSVYYESFPLVIVEAFATGLPVIATSGSMSSLVIHGRTGLLINRGDPKDLAERLMWLWSHPTERAQMSREARQTFEQRYTGESNYQELMDIYALAMARARQRFGDPVSGTPRWH